MFPLRAAIRQSSRRTWFFHGEMQSKRYVSLQRPQDSNQMEEPLRACGVADTATEAGPREPSGVMGPLMW